ncbi:holo-ACP synthase [Demequina sp. B12]|uniref:holo-ACP synthase n=1 Tax=Demequina sp. B12 TaxID=2992757 RepID=UPI00237BF5A1|nr:holo-ACP synthase [Demequina sp. B12]MDE0572472.1 holo-ACP synthase [Demequina sp. B12]
MAVKGVGIDVVAIERFEDTVRKSPTFVTRVFTPAERDVGTASLAARWAAKEALAKALGAPSGLHWHDCEVVREDGGRPTMVMRGSVAARAELLGITSVHVSLSHDAGIASAVVVAEGD